MVTCEAQSHMNTIDEIKLVLAETLNLEASEISDDAAMGQLTGWDSLGHLNIMSALGERFDKEVPFEQITELGDLKSLVEYFQ